MKATYYKKYRKSSLLDFKRILLSAAMYLVLLLNISGNLSAQGGVWTWMSGSDTSFSFGNYGIKGVSNPENEPPARYQAAHWKDKDGNFWMFGGFNSQFLYNDLWKFNPSTNEWTWMHGPDLPNQESVFGEKGVPSPLNNPPTLSWGSLCWYDRDDALYLYGGAGSNPSANIWKFSISLNEWVWLTGSEVTNDLQAAGTKGVPSPLNTPGTRAENETNWVYKDKLWFSCGQFKFGTSSSTWHFDLKSLEWTWVHGPLGVQMNSIKGDLGIYNEQNLPSSRFSWSKLAYKESAYVFSGEGTNDLWQFNADSLAWRFLGEGDGFPYFEDYCIIHEETRPEQTAEFQSAVSLVECKEILWVNGGIANPALWAYDIDQRIWILVWGVPDSWEYPVYGEKGVPSIDNLPPEKNGACMWSDNLGNLWEFGGASHFGHTSDMWRFEPDYSCITNLDSSECCELTVTFSITNTSNMDSAGSVEIQVVDGEGVIEYSIDGGMTWSTDNFFDELPPGDYDIVVRDETGCIYTGTITILDIGVGVNDLSGAEVLLKPNPTRDILYIEINDISITSDQARIRLIDAQGKNCIKAIASIENNSLETKISLAGLASGSYYLQIYIGENNILKKVTKI